MYWWEYASVHDRVPTRRLTTGWTSPDNEHSIALSIEILSNKSTMVFSRMHNTTHQTQSETLKIIVQLNSRSQSLEDGYIHRCPIKDRRERLRSKETLALCLIYQLRRSFRMAMGSQMCRSISDRGWNLCFCGSKMKPVIYPSVSNKQTTARNHFRS
jgi:hypothetical protein